MKRTIYLLCFSVMLFACMKDRLKDDKAIFIGTWNWVYTDHQYGWCDGDDFSEILTPVSENITFRLEFLEKGVVNFYENNQFSQKYRIKFVGFESYGESSAHFGIDLDNEKESVFDGYIYQDTILLGGFSNFIFESQFGCEQYKNYFVREF